jgi:alkylation response protein AidB-like acyl-CoA dehydrogenase
VDFAPSVNPEQAAFRTEVREWLKAHVPKIDGDPDSDENYAKYRQLGRDLGSKGWLYPTFPAAYGGGGLNFEQSVVIHEEMDRYSLGMPPYYDPAGTLGGPSILVWGSEEQKKRLLTPMFRGEIAGWIALTGPEAGSDLAGTQTDAVRDGDEYVINGTKIFIGGSHIPDILWTFTRTAPNGPRHKNTSWFVIPTDAPGVTIRRMELLGDGGEGVGAGVKNTIYFQNVRVPRENLIGGENNGWQVANTHLELEHGGGGSLGRNRWFARTLEWARQQQRNGRPLIEDADARDRIADVYMETEVTQVIRLRNYWMNRTRQHMSYEGSQSSYMGKMSGLRVTAAQLDLFGPATLISGGDHDFSHGALDHYTRGAITALHPGGTADVQKLLIARRIGAGREEAEEAGKTPD